ncbi:nucleotide exchange factor GrpE [Streptomyces fagopyri]|uniref:nucleotide exchange factor GrpE n=1 Tax=Streptomyces fagopyri TaxID=2662397 RepID=UPI0033FB6D80
MRTYPQESSRAASNQVEPVPEGAVRPRRGDLPQPGPPTRPEAGNGEPGPRKRHARELERERAVERSRTAAAFLPVLDNLELALPHACAYPGAIVDGIRAVRDQAVNVLELLGYPRHAETGVASDPARHEVTGVVQDPGAPPGTVVEVLRPGYVDGERQLRPAAVTVAKRE